MVLGIDTSCYTTSVALVGESGLAIDRRLLLEVPKGTRGLRQAEAVFQHVQNLPNLLSEVLPRRDITGVAVSSTPRSVADSYMPVFKVGEGTAQSLALALDVPCYFTSHQAGHIWAGLHGTGLNWAGDFLALHVSGGTTEVALVRLDESRNMELSVLGGSLDIHAGQLIDRIGVELGLAFPAGPHLEKLAKEGRSQGIDSVDLPVSVSGLHANLSGPEAAAKRALKRGADPLGLAQGIEDCVARTITALAKNAASDREQDRILIVGGVAANQYIRHFLATSLEEAGITVGFAPSALSSDNAVGVAAYGLWQAGTYRVHSCATNGE
ncbi:MAG: O-sialoglycoprotein endopeptidase [Firmicutes bacterium]|nr:O-sialoglycoprotein endopeptidase [Bacillota bacterium]